MNRCLLLVTAAAVLLSCNISAAQKSWPKGLSKGSTVIVKIPVEMMDKEGVSMALTTIYGVEAEKVVSQSGWQAKSFPLMANFVVEKINEWKSPSGVRCVQIEVRNPVAWVKVRFDPAKNLDSRFGEVFATGNLPTFKESAYFRKEVFDPIAARIFVGPLAGLPYREKLALLEFVHFREDAVTAGTYKGKSFVSVEIANTDVFNSLRLDQAARVARVINDNLLSLIKTFATVAEDAGIEGIKLVTTIQHKSFLEESAVPTKDRMEVYVQLSKAQGFKDADITSQQLMDASVILLNDNRIEAVLTSSAR